MTTSDAAYYNRPFENLGKLLKKNARNMLVDVSDKIPAESDCGEPEEKTDRQIFMEAMADVIPIKNSGKAVATGRVSIDKRMIPSESQEIRQKLDKLVRVGEGFVVSQTPEYMEGTGYQVPRQIARRLHRGDFSIQDHIDLHGLDVFSARQAFDRFFERSIREGLRAVLIIHGRGLSSPREPVLKTKVKQWLCTNRWRKWIIAFTSARLCDGGAGATYVLLRQAPLPKRFRKQKPQLTKN